MLVVATVAFGEAVRLFFFNWHLGFFVEEPPPLTTLYVAANQVGGKLVALEECHLLDLVQNMDYIRIISNVFSNDIPQKIPRQSALSCVDYSKTSVKLFYRFLSQ